MLRLDDDEKCFLERVRNKASEYDLDIPLYVFDIGAASGHYSEYIRTVFWSVDQLRLHLFEPVYSQYRKLRRLYKDIPTMTLNNVAVSNLVGDGAFVVAPNLEHSHIRYDDPLVETREVVATKITSIDNYIAENCLQTQNFLLFKIDVEGNEFKVLDGAINLLNSPYAPKFIQLEYGSWWQWEGRMMRECIDFLYRMGYNAFEYSPTGKKIIPTSSSIFVEDFGYRNLLFELFI